VRPADADALAGVQRRSYAAAGASIRRSWPERQALDSGRLARFLDGRRYGVLATTRRDGRAHATPVAYLVSSGAFWIGTVAGLRLQNLRATPWASLVVMAGERDEGEPGVGELHVAVTAEGPVSLHEETAFDDAYAPLADDWVRRHGHAPDWAEALIELRPERLFSHDAGA
jgi:nitroimidazol reductase NimA-like FMN-containing flavoprotein (pyridoxamine 5'-phosphate oxidase superfamily)